MVQVLLFTVGVIFGAIGGILVVAYWLVGRIIGTLRVESSNPGNPLLYLEVNEGKESELIADHYVLMRVAKDVYIPRN